MPVIKSKSRKCYNLFTKIRIKRIKQEMLCGLQAGKKNMQQKQIGIDYFPKTGILKTGSFSRTGQPY